MGVLGEGVVFDRPDAVEAHLLGEDGLFDAVVEDAVFAVGGRVDELCFEDHGELHGELLPERIGDYA